MFTTIQFVPGAVVAGVNINLPTGAPPIDAVASAYIIRPTAQLTVGGAAVADHAAHSHTENTAAAYQQNATTATATTSAHVVTQPSLTGANPVVAATPTKVDGGTITLNVNTALGDLLSLTYIAVGVRAKVA